MFFAATLLPCDLVAARPFWLSLSRCWFGIFVLLLLLVCFSYCFAVFFVVFFCLFPGSVFDVPAPADGELPVQAAATLVRQVRQAQGGGLLRGVLPGHQGSCADVCPLSWLRVHSGHSY